MSKNKKSNSPPDDPVDPEEAMRRMDEALKRMLGRKPETHDEMLRRRHRKGETKPQPKR